jgi:hypothetical protein
LPIIYTKRNPNTPAATIATNALIIPLLLPAPVYGADELVTEAGAEEVADVWITETLDEVGPVDADDPVVALAVATLAAVMTPPPTFWGAEAFALAAAEI